MHGVTLFCPTDWKGRQRYICLLVKTFMQKFHLFTRASRFKSFWVVVLAIYRRDQTDGWLPTTSYWDLNGRPKIPQWSFSGSGKRSWWQRYLRTFDLNTKHMFVMKVILALCCWILLGPWDIMMPMRHQAFGYYGVEGRGSCTYCRQDINIWE